MSFSNPLDTRLLKALAHPLRERILESITDRGEASPVELARELDQPLATVSHHTRVLRDLGCIELVRTEPRRGAVEHYYRPVLRPFLDDEQWEQLSLVKRRGLAAQLLRRVFAEASAAGAHGGFDTAGAHVARMPLALDDRGWQELADAVTAILSAAEAIQQRSDQRRGDDGEDSDAVRRSELAILHFAVADDAAPSAPSAPAPRAGGRRNRPSRSE
jgi:DNA-binding transcriptional ArsR family regulator